LNRLITGKPHRLDVGRVVVDTTRPDDLYPAGQYFGNGVGIGFDAVVGFEALKLNRSAFYRWFSFATYLVAALRTILLYHHFPLLRIEADTLQVEQPALMVSIMNGWRLGGLFKMAPQARLDDGWLDLCIAGQVSRASMLALIVHFMRGTQFSHPAIRAARVRRLHICALQGVLPAHADGETLCTAGHELTIDVLPQALQVLASPGDGRDEQHL
jgi:diacylglycerol kinase family enzyme